MTAGTLSAMPVVFEITPLTDWPTVLTKATGLYYKLHGRHRPSGMNKGNIKRRKRVMPAMPNSQAQASHQQTSSGFSESSVSPDPSQPLSYTADQDQRSSTDTLQLPPAQTNLPLHQHDRRSSDHQRHQDTRPSHVLEPQYQTYGPPPVDFTYHNRKRPHTGDVEGDRDHDRDSPMALEERMGLTSRASMDTSIDPTLGPGESREQVRARLRLEQQRMRERLMVVERQLERMEQEE